MGFLNEHLGETNREASTVAQDLRRNNHDRDMKIATWVLVGNGAALLATFNAVINRQLCGWSVIQPYALAFLFGLVCALAHVVFEGEAESRGTARLTLLMGAARRAAIGIDSNNAFHAWMKENGRDEVVDAQIKANDATIADAKKVLESNSEQPWQEKVLHKAGRLMLALSALSLGGALFFAINSGAVQNAACH